MSAQPEPTLYRVETPHFVAGFTLSNETVVTAAPIIAWMVGKPMTVIQQYCCSKKWMLKAVPEA